MNKIKKCILVFCALFCFMLTGCAQINYTRVVYDDGSIKDVYEIVFEKDKIRSTLLLHDFSMEQADYYNRQFCLKSYELVKKYEEKVNFSFGLKLSQAILEGKLTSEEALTYKDQIRFIASMDGTSYEWVRYSRVFSTAEAFNCYNHLYDSGEDEEEESGYQLEDGFFFYRYSISVDNFYHSLVAALKEEDNAFETTYEELLNDFGMDLFTEADLNVTQTYISTEKRLHSNADYSAKENGYYLKEWNISTTDCTKLTYFYYVANSTNWYLLCMGVAVVVVGVLAVVVVICSKKKSKL